jgi:hypothetical protein
MKIKIRCTINKWRRSKEVGEPMNEVIINHTYDGRSNNLDHATTISNLVLNHHEMISKKTTSILPHSYQKIKEKANKSLRVES